MKEIVPGIWTWSVFNQERGMNFNGHLLVNDEGCVMVDPPPLDPRDMARAEELGPPSAIVITNRHHTRDAMVPAGLFHTRILLHEADAAAIPSAVRLGGLFRDGDRLPAGLLVVTLKDQKSPGESALLCRKANAIILGDALIGKPSGSLGLLSPDKYADVSKAREGIRRLLDCPFEAVLVGDGESIPRGGRAAVEAFLARA
jgi:glyoxylase-like metal-dependent hydrolase (beta-lactamase superfamily II)